MLVDDEATLAKTTAKRLDKRRITTILAFSGEECLEALAKYKNIDVIVLDIKMPGMDGIETLQRIKKEAPLTEVIMLTGYATVQSGIEGMKLGAYDYLVKPCDIEELANKIEKATARKQAHEEKISNWGSFMEIASLKELMVPISEYATVSKDATILEAITALEDAQKAFYPNRYRHRAVLVVDQNTQVVGKLSQHDIIQALEPQHKGIKVRKKGALDHFGFSQKFIDSTYLQYDRWDRPLHNLYKKAVEQKVSAFMHTPSDGEYIKASETLNEAIHRLIIGDHHSLLVTDGNDIVGILRLTDVFELVHLRLKTLHLAATIAGETNRADNNEKADTV
jgi:DNA-binding response OmpR family regulator